MTLAGNAPAVDPERIRQIAALFDRLGCALLNDAAPEDAVLIDLPVVNRTPGLRLAGPVAAVATEDDMLPCLQLLDAAPFGSVLFLQNVKPGRSEALVGDIYATAMRSHGLRGVVVDGAVRDTADLREIGLPVYSTELTFLSARTAQRAATVVPGPVEVPVRRPSSAGADAPRQATLATGDWLFADEDGLMSVRAERVSVVISAAQLLAEREAELKDALDRGGRMGELCGLDGYLAGTADLRFSF
jgi:4-hydroxy-4-methyl-2-oxoglutarate aldolase